MFGLAILETAIGITLIYILCSLVCSVANEWLTRKQALRPRFLHRDLHQLLGPELARLLEQHPLITGLLDASSEPTARRYPNYIPPSTFATALIHIGYVFKPGRGGRPGKIGLKELSFCSPPVDTSLLESLKQEGTSLGALQARIEQWFTLSMDQVSGRYKKRVQVYILIFAAILVLAGNIDTIALAQFLYDGAMKEVPVIFPLGWPKNVPFSDRVLRKLGGLFVSWAAISLGAPFWFDMLNKLVNLRQTGLRPNASARSASQFTAQ